MSLKAYSYLISVGLFGFVVLVTEISLFRLDFSEFGLALIFLSVASFLAEIYELEVVPKWRLSTGIALGLAGIFIGGLPLGVWVVFVSSFLAEILLRWDNIKDSFQEFLLRIIFNTGQLVISVVSAGLVFELVGGHPPPYNSISDYLPLLFTFLVYELVNLSLVSVIISLVTESRFTYILRYSLKNLHLQFSTMGVLAILMAILYSTSPWNLIIVFIPLALVHYSMRSYLRLRRNSHTAFTHIADLIGKRDKYTGEHSVDVVKLAIKLTNVLELSDGKIESIRMAAAIHDIGKIVVPDAILHKAGPLNEEEWKVMKQHPIVGSEIIKDLEIYRDVVPIVRHEHEHWNGKGYPDGLEGEAIPLGARIVAVADVYSALTTERAYRPIQNKPLKYTHEQACEIMRGMAGKVLDPNLVDLFINKALDHQEVD